MTDVFVFCLQTPDFYADTPPAPAGLTWWHYRPGVPPLPQPATYFGLSNWTDWGWQYDPDYSVPFYEFSNLDQVLASCQLSSLLCTILQLDDLYPAALAACVAEDLPVLPSSLWLQYMRRGFRACITLGSAHDAHCHADRAMQEGKI